MKRCRKCGEEKSLEAFPPRSRKHARDGRYSYCRPCSRILSAERNALWRKRNPEKARAKSTAGSRALRERDPDYHRRWYEANAEKERARSRQVMREHRARNPERAREQVREWRARHPDRARAFDSANTHNRRAFKAATARSLLGGYSFAYMTTFIADLLLQPCEYCGGPGGTLDHVVPLSRGGPHIPANLASACLHCNLSKGTKLLSEWSRATPSRV